MTPKVVVDCIEMERCYRWPNEPWISACHIHMEECDSCRQKYTPYFTAIDNDLSHGINTLSNAIQSFYTLAKQCGQDGEPGAAGALAINAANQVMSDFKVYMDKYPNHNIAALIWLQKVFAVCRFFESQPRCERDIPPEEKHLKVSEMVAPDEEGSFGQITTLSYLMKNNDKYSTFTFNRDLYQQTTDLLRSGEYYRALRLICDSPKHGILSSILNFGALVSAKQVYSIGLHALAHAINIFVEEYRAKNGLPDPQKHHRPDFADCEQEISNHCKGGMSSLF